ncbi:hypothetical protein P153DRAFT_313451 [Dothidotthia symphoricarpi CBS 119687]|uniref:Uncharacterized protein n=1 Tax=Dothidotthia symphoricarpi CBS 119687 TaxID=1392245 RepID=A0A6A6AGP9_9PLEO|nr:uncharacterized protein P153DRAFT_313451 [Dothidotthia symphoricarpi CBS 119687]KAF2131109.1 hypothetical protein P153DRAFT_313451 [Dothidotthia symphoricarpi CBS 119687]
MGGHAFKGLHCPRISPDVYAKVKTQTTTALQTIFSHVVVPTEMPEKENYGDIDFLVSGGFHSSITADTFDWPSTVHAIKTAFNTIHGRRGFLNPDCMYFAIAAQDEHEEYFVQVDVKVCFKPELFEWYTFELNYASNSKMIGSMVKPLGLTIDPEGLHIRVEDIEGTNFPGSMVRVSKDPRDVLRVLGLDRRIVDGGFKTKNEIYEYFASSWLFNPAHFAARLAKEKYNDRLDDRSPHWTHFIRQWVPKHYPDYKFLGNPTLGDRDGDVDQQQDKNLQQWYKQTRAAVKEKVLTMFPHVAVTYYTKRAAHVKELEERRLRKLIIEALPTGADGWKDDFPRPQIITINNQAEPVTPELKPVVDGELTPPLTPTILSGNALDNTILPLSISSLTPPIASTQSWNVPLYLEPLPRSPPLTCTPHPPPAKMSLDAKLLCLARWTLFDPDTGAPYLLSTPRDKDFDMHWTDARYAGATDDVLTKWARDMWWHVWVRQSYVNYVGMWKKRFEKEDKKAEKAREVAAAERQAEELVRANKQKILNRLRAVNVGLGLVDGGVETS